MDSDHISLFDLGLTKIIENLSQRFVDAMDPMQPTLYIEPSQKLAQLIFDPLRPVLKNNSLIVVPNSTVQNISFEALSNSSGTKISKMDRERFLIEEFSFVYTFSGLSFLSSQNSATVKTDRNLLAVAPVFDNQERMSPEVRRFLSRNIGDEGGGQITIEPLLGSISELEYISSPSGPKKFRSIQLPKMESLLREKATEFAIKNGDLRKFNFIHLATHSFSDPNDPLSSGILLELDGAQGEDGILYASEVWGLNIDAKLVVLSSCETAKGGNSELTSLSGFASGFFFAGAQNLLASIWPSDDLGNQILMNQFYSHVWSGESIQTSLRQAKLELLSDEGPISHPYYWSGLIHIGSSIASASGPVAISEGR